MPQNRRRARNPLFAKRWFSDEVILVSVGWYLRFKLSYRDLAQILGQMGVAVAPCTILRWVVRYSPDFAECWRHLEKPVGRSWRCDETYIKVGGRWMYLYRAVDERGRTVASHLSRRFGNLNTGAAEPVLAWNVSRTSGAQRWIMPYIFIANLPCLIMSGSR